jgi:hypothetical protein
MAQFETDIKAAQGDTAYQLFDMAELGTLLAQKLTPGRHVKEEIADIQGGSFRMGGRLRFLMDLITFAAYRPARIVIVDTRSHCQPGDRGDTRQRLASKAKTADMLQILKTADLAGGMPAQSKPKLITRYSAAIITNAQTTHTTLFNLNADIAGTRIKAVFQELLGHGRWPFHHLTGGDLIN